MILKGYYVSSCVVYATLGLFNAKDVQTTSYKYN